ncbi:MAG: FtsX-like permease family protein [Calditrichaeota bacterium]|nr:MAG: FtsX-like permease family protein [Calditrichota bacterium]
MIDYFREAWLVFRSHKVRSFLTTLGIFIGVTTIIIIFTIIKSINTYIVGEFSQLGSTTIYVDKFPWVITENFFEYRNRPPITLREYQVLKRKLVGIRWISPIVNYQRKVTYRDEVLEQVMIVGSNEVYPEVGNISADVGRWFTAQEVRSARAVCVLGVQVVEELFGKEDPLGKRIKINGYPYKVIGLLEKKGKFFGFDMDKQVMIPYTSMRGYAYRWRGISIGIKIPPEMDLDAVKEEVRGIMRSARKIPPGEKDNFSINQQDMLTDFYKQITGTAYIVIFIIGGISLIVGGIGIMNIMLVSVTERTREIGIRKAVGATRSHILLQFLTESVTISSIGGILGVIAGVLLANIPLSMMKLSASVSVTTVLIGYGFSAFVGIVSGLYPAQKAARQNPVEALRYE